MLRQYIHWRRLIGTTVQIRSMARSSAQERSMMPRQTPQRSGSQATPPNHARCTKPYEGSRYEQKRMKPKTDSLRHVLDDLLETLVASELPRISFGLDAVDRRALHCGDPRACHSRAQRP